MWLICYIAHKGEERIKWSTQHNHESNIALHVYMNAGVHKILKNLGATSNPRRQKSFMMKLPYWGSINIGATLQNLVATMAPNISTTKKN